MDRRTFLELTRAFGANLILNISISQQIVEALSPTKANDLIRRIQNTDFEGKAEILDSHIEKGLDIALVYIPQVHRYPFPESIEPSTLNSMESEVIEVQKQVRYILDKVNLEVLGLKEVMLVSKI